MSMDPVSPSLPDEHRRKRVRKGTKSCWECKRRKIRCQLSTEDVSVCSGCLTRGTSCLSQEYPEEYDGHTGNHNQVGERLGRVEILLEKIMSKMNEYDEEEKAQNTLHTPEYMGPNDVYVSDPSKNGTGAAPILSLFDNSVIGRANAIAYLTPSTNSSMPSPSQSATKTPSCRPSKTERLRQTLSDLLPDQHDADLVCEESGSWMLMHAFALYTHAKNSPLSAAKIDPRSHVPFGFDMLELHKKEPANISLTLLYITICFQQLPPEFDANRLHLKTSIKSRIDRYISTVQSLVTSDDELVSSIDGLQCLILQGVIHINSGNPRRAWLSFRRAMNIAQLMGLSKPSTSVSGGRDIWHSIVRGDRYLGLLLGLPAGSVDDLVETTDTGNPELDQEYDLVKGLSRVTGSLIDRNQKDETQTYTATQEIDEKMEKLGNEMPASWWIVPDHIPDDRSFLSAQTFETLMTQIWFFQLQAILHLPFMLRNERRFDYSRFTCLKASREIISRYVALRSTKTKSFCCKIVDFGALTATVTLLLKLLEIPAAGESREALERKEADRALVRTVMASMDELSRASGDIVVTQCFSVIKTLLSAESHEGSGGSNLRLTIPYFGTVNITRRNPQSNTSQNSEKTYSGVHLPPIPDTSSAWQAPPYLSYNAISAPGPVVSFTSSQFPAYFPEQHVENWGMQEADTLFFDSMLNTDIEGNWIF